MTTTRPRPLTYAKTSPTESTESTEPTDPPTTDPPPTHPVTVPPDPPPTHLAVIDPSTHPVTVPPDRPWHRQPDEPNFLYDRFLIYRALGPDRSVAEAHRRYLAREHGTTEDEMPDKPPRSWYKSFHEYDWQARATAYDDYIRIDAERETTQLLRQWYAESTADLLRVWNDLSDAWIESTDEMTKNQIIQAMKTVTRELSSRTRPETTLSISVILDQLPVDVQAALADKLNSS